MLLTFAFGGGPREAKCLMLVEGLHVFLPPASIKAQIIMKGISKNGTATIKIM